MAPTARHHTPNPPSRPPAAGVDLDQHARPPAV